MAKSEKSTNQNTSSKAADRINAYLAVNPAFGPQSKHFWQAQDQILEEAEKFSSAWFKRRHEATQSALEAVSHMALNGMQDPAGALTVMADWQKHSMERLAEDAKECSEMMTRCASSFVSHEIDAAEETAKTAKDIAETGTKKAKADHATPV